MKNSRSLLATGALLAGGCATPPAVLNQAQFSTAAMGEMQQNLAEFRRQEAAFETRRLHLLAQVQAATADAIKRNGPEMRAWESIGDVAVLSAMKRLRKQADAMASDANVADMTAQKNAAALAALLTPLPDTGPAITTAQAAMAALTNEQSRAERLKLSIAYGRVVVAGVKANATKVKAANDEAQKAMDAAASSASSK